jgi:hypothetical protein
VREKSVEGFFSVLTNLKISKLKNFAQRKITGGLSSFFCQFNPAGVLHAINNVRRSFFHFRKIDEIPSKMARARSRNVVVFFAV